MNNSQVQYIYGTNVNKQIQPVRYTGTTLENSTIAYDINKYDGEVSPTTSGACFVPTFCSQVTDVPEVECEALVALYNSTNGPSRNNNTNWLGNGDSSPTTVCDRYGITCNGGNVTWIAL